MIGLDIYYQNGLIDVADLIIICLTVRMVLRLLWFKFIAAKLLI